MKKYYLPFLLLCVMSIHMLAQESGKSSKPSKAFEGELHYRTLENYEKKYLKACAGMTNAYNGARDLTFIVKGGKVLMKDESMHYNVLLDPEGDFLIYYSELTGKGLTASCHKHAAQISMNSKKGMYNDYLHKYFPPEVYRFEPSGKKLQYKGKEYPIINGRSEANISGGEDEFTAKYLVTIFELAEDTCYRLPRAFFVIFSEGVERERLLVKYSWDRVWDIPGFGKVKSYACSELRDMTERPVSDEEFKVPEGIKMEKECLQGTSLSTFWLGHNRYLKKHNIHPEQVNRQVVYDINEEWDF